jgi:hypothetical protein
MHKIYLLFSGFISSFTLIFFSFAQPAGQADASTLTPEEIQAALLASQNQDQIPAFISSVPQEEANNNVPAASDCGGASSGSSPLEKYGVVTQSQENAAPQINIEDDIEKKTRRIASKLHIMASKKQLDPVVRSSFMF